MTKVKLDEEFLQWWERGLEEEGYDLHKKQLKVLADPTKSLYHVYSYHEFFNAMRRGEYAALLAYHFAYSICNRSRLEKIVQEGKIIPFKKRS